MADAEDHAVGAADEFPEGTWSVARLNEEIEAVLSEQQSRFPTYVVGEISEVSSYGYGTFFSLRDLESDATISSLAWRNAVEGFDHELEEGVSAVVQASVDFYPERGDTQLVVSDYWPVGESARMQELQDTIIVAGYPRDT